MNHGPLFEPRVRGAVPSEPMTFREIEPHVIGYDPEWTLQAWTDGSGTILDGPCGVGVVLAQGRVALVECSMVLARGSNNVAECYAIGTALMAARSLLRSRSQVEICSDSAFALGACHPDSTWNVRSSRLLTSIVIAARTEAKRWDSITWTQVPGHHGLAHNERADALAKRARKVSLERRTQQETSAP